MRSPRARVRSASDTDLIGMVVCGLVSNDIGENRAAERAVGELKRRGWYDHTGRCVCADCFVGYDELVGLGELEREL